MAGGKVYNWAKISIEKVHEYRRYIDIVVEKAGKYRRYIDIGDLGKYRKAYRDKYVQANLCVRLRGLENMALGNMYRASR